MDKKKVLISCLAVLALILAVRRIQSDKTPKQTQVYSLSDYAYTELEGSTVYRADDMVVVDSYARNRHTVNGKVTNTTMYYLVLFYDKNDRPVVAGLSVDDDDSIYTALLQYSLDDDQLIGDYVLNGYVKTSKNTNTELTQYFNEAIDQYGPVLDEYLVSPEWMLVYHCGALEDPLK